MLYCRLLRNITNKRILQRQYQALTHTKQLEGVDILGLLCIMNMLYNDKN